MNETIISIQNVHKSIGETELLHGINLNIHRGESLAIIGGSGSGKSVLLKVMTGLMKPSSGRVLIAGCDIYSNKKTDISNVMNKIAVLFQSNALFDSMKIWENLIFAANHGRIKRDTASKQLALSILEEVDLDHSVTNLYPAELSGGMQKRVALARTLITAPEIMILDEPTTGLDPINGNKIMTLINKFRKQPNRTTVMVTHSINQALNAADSIAVILRGNLIWHGKVSEIKDCTHPHVHELYSFSLTNKTDD